MNSHTDIFAVRKVVIIEDQPLDALLLKQLLRQQLGKAEIVHFRTLDAFDEVLVTTWQEETLFLIDYYLGDRTAAEVVNRLRLQRSNCSNAPIIILTGSSERAVAVAAVSCGADELLYKQDLDADTLQVALIKALRGWQRRKARKMSVDNLQQLGRMLAHDLRNPISSIVTASDLLYTTPGLNDEARQIIDMIEASAKQSLEIINERLAGLQNMLPSFQTENTTSLRLSGPIAEIRLLYGLHLETIGGRIELGPLVSMPLAAPLLKQVLMNLIDNAIKYRRDDPLRIFISTYNTGEETGLIFEDNGKGIGADKREAVFDAPMGFTGNGLPHIRRSLEAEGATIDCDSDGETYSRFLIRILANTDVEQIS